MPTSIPNYFKKASYGPQPITRGQVMAPFRYLAKMQSNAEFLAKTELKGFGLDVTIDDVKLNMEPDGNQLFIDYEVHFTNHTAGDVHGKINIPLDWLYEPPFPVEWPMLDSEDGEVEEVE